MRTVATVLVAVAVLACAAACKRADAEDQSQPASTAVGYSARLAGLPGGAPTSR